MSQPLVSICCAVYNHEAYISATLDGFLMQECDFEYEILIHDDASTDKSADIIREYEAEYPHIIFPIYQSENQYSQGKKYSDLNYERARGKYVALCEGDDYWTSPKKLAMQVKLLEENPEYELCFHKAKEYHVQNETSKTIGVYRKDSGVVPIEDIILKKYGMIPTASIMITTRALNDVLGFKSTRKYLSVGDIYIQIFGSLRAKGALFLNENFSVYRFATPTSWSSNWLKSIENQNKHLIAMARSFQELNILTKGEYQNSFEYSTFKRIIYLLSLIDTLDPHTTKLDLQLLPKFTHCYINALQRYLQQLSHNETFILYGSGSGAKLILETIGEKIAMIIDSDLKKEGTLFMGKKIVHIITFKNLKSEQKVLFSLLGRYDEITPQLDESLQTRLINLDTFIQKCYCFDSIKFHEQ
jgi:glycosyltransferase involved in cell wall biosynthesis